MLASTLQNSLSNGRVYEFCLRENVSYADNAQEKVFIEVLFFSRLLLLAILLSPHLM